MQTTTPDLPTLISMRNSMLTSQKELYLSAVANINMRNRELLKNDFGSTLVKNCAWDAADMIVNQYLNTADFYISPQQMYERIVHFSYDQDSIQLDDATIRKMLYENQNNVDILQDIMNQSVQAGQNLFTGDRKKDPIDKKTNDYRLRREKDGPLTDDITGKEGTFETRNRNGKDYTVSTLHADHVLARDSIQYDTRYISQKRLDDLKEFYYSDENFWLIHASANSSKGAVRVCETSDGVVFMSDKEFKKTSEKVTDITWKATAEQYADATIYMWEKETESGHKIETLKEEGYLDEDGKVRPEVKEKLIQTYRDAMNAEGRHMILPYYKVDEQTGKKELHMPWLNYANIANDAGEYTRKALKKIIVGQIIYYVLPPTVFEVQTIVRKKRMTLETLFRELKQSGKRIVRYVSSKMGEILSNIAGNAFHKFLKTFFDIIIEAVRETVKKLLKIVKQLVLSLVNSVRIIADRNRSAAEKADAVTKTLSVTIATAALEVIFEWAEKEFGLPNILMEPLQIIVTIIATNLIMLILQKADLFDVQYGLLVANIERVFAEEEQAYINESSKLLKLQEEEMTVYMDSLKEQIGEIETSIISLDLYKDEATEELNKINEIFNMGIDFDKEWSDFIAV